MATKARNSHATTGREGRQAEVVGFWMCLRLPPGLSMRAQTLFLRNLEEKIHDLGLRVAGDTQLRFFVEGADREVSRADQIDLADWLLLHTLATEIVITELMTDPETPGAESKVLRIDRWDMATIGVGLLYRMGRIKADQYAELLGGFVVDPSRGVSA